MAVNKFYPVPKLRENTVFGDLIRINLPTVYIVDLFQ